MRPPPEIERARAKAQYEKRKNDPKWVAKRTATCKAWKQRNRQRTKAWQAAWVSANREQWRVLQRRGGKIFRAKPKNRAMLNVRRRLRQLVKSGRATSVRRNEMIGCDPAFLISYLSVRLLPGMSWENYGTSWHIDHVKPCAKFDLSKKREVKKCFHFTNLQPLWAKENGEKLDRVPTQQTLAL